MYDKIAVYYDVTHAKLTADRAFILDLAQQTGDPILELGCGSGRLLLPLVTAGFHVTGLDISSTMLARARERLLVEPAEAQSRARLIETDILQWQNDGLQFALIIIPYNTLMHFNLQQMQRLFRGIHAWLGENGRLFIDLENPFMIGAAASHDEFFLEEQFVVPDTGENVQQFSRMALDSDAQILNVEWKFVVDGNGRNDAVTQVDMTYHYWFPHQLEMALTRAGLKLKHIFGGYGRIPFTENSPRLILVAERLVID